MNVNLSKIQNADTINSIYSMSRLVGSSKKRIRLIPLSVYLPIWINSFLSSNLDNILIRLDYTHSVSSDDVRVGFVTFFFGSLSFGRFLDASENILAY